MPNSVGPSSSAPTHIPLVAQKAWKIMLLDPSAAFAQKLRTLLEDNAQFELAEWVTSGTGWISLWRSAKPDFLFVAEELPKRDGLFCIEKMKSMDPQIIVVLMHNFEGAMANNVELKALAMGASAVLQRPFTDQRFHVTLKRLAQLKTKISNLKRLKFV